MDANLIRPTMGVTVCMRVHDVVGLVQFRPRVSGGARRGDVRDGSDVVPIEAVPEAEQEAGDENADTSGASGDRRGYVDERGIKE